MNKYVIITFLICGKKIHCFLGVMKTVLIEY